MSFGKVLVAGSSGVVGQAAVEAFVAAGWDVIAVSRRAPDIAPSSRWRHLVLDLLDAEACKTAAQGMGGVTHVAYAALYEKPGLVAGWRDQDQMATNLAMLRNLLGPLRDHAQLAHVSLLQGTKAYGVHLKPFAVPARESWPRHPHANFYWLQEDFVRSELAPRGIGFTIFRPQIVFGDAIGAAMNVLPVLTAYGAICRHEGRLVLLSGRSGLSARGGGRAVDRTRAGVGCERFGGAQRDLQYHQWRRVLLAQRLAGHCGCARLAAGRGCAAEARRMAAGQSTTCGTRSSSVSVCRSVPLVDLLGQSHIYADFVMASRS